MNQQSQALRFFSNTTYMRFVLTFAILLVVLTIPSAAREDEGEVLFVECDAMIGCNVEFEPVLKAAFQPVGPISGIEVIYDDTTLTRVEHLSREFPDPRSYVKNTRDPNLFVCGTAHIYILLASRWNGNLFNCPDNLCLSEVFRSFGAPGGAIIIVYVDAVRELCKRPEYECLDLDSETACASILLSRIGELFRLERHSPDVTEICREPKNLSVMTAHPHSLKIIRFSSHEIRILNEGIDKP